MSKLLEQIFVGYHSNRFNLSMQYVVDNDSRIIGIVRKLNLKLLDPIPPTKLRISTQLRAVCSNATYWSSTSCMLKRYIEVQENLCEFDDRQVQRLILIDTQFSRIDASLKSLMTSRKRS